MAKVNDGDLVLATGEKIVTEKVDARSNAGLLLQDDGGNYIKINDGGIVDISKQSCARVYLGSNQSITNATYRRVNVNTEVFDVQGEFDNSVNYRFTATQAGYYIVIGQICMYNLTDGKNMYCCIYKNGAVISRTINRIGRVTNPRMQTGKICYLAVNDYIELWIYHNYGASRNAYAGSNNTFLSIHKLS